MNDPDRFSDGDRQNLRREALHRLQRLTEQMEKARADLDAHLSMARSAGPVLVGSDSGKNAAEILSGGRRATDAVILAARRVCDRLGSNKSVAADAQKPIDRQET